MKWEVVANYDELSARAARLLLDTVSRKRDAVLGLPTGRTPIGMYNRVVEECGRKYHCFRDVRTFNLDEYVGIPREHPGSYYAYMKQHLFDRVDLQPENVHLPAAQADDDETLRRECARYEEKLRTAGGLDVTFLGLGRNGHIGFNEPGTPFDSRTHVIELTESTRIANADLFEDGHVPERAVTMGIGTILESRTVVLMASGKSKVEAVAELQERGPHVEFPASALKNHPDVIVLVDQDAAKGLLRQ